MRHSVRFWLIWRNCVVSQSRNTETACFCKISWAYKEKSNNIQKVGAEKRKVGKEAHERGRETNETFLSGIKDPTVEVGGRAKTRIISWVKWGGSSRWKLMSSNFL